MDKTMITREPAESNYLDARTPEERANEPEGITTSNRETENWEEEFDDWVEATGVFAKETSPYYEAKAIIRKSISSEKARLREKVLKMKVDDDDDYANGYNQALDEVKEILK